MSLRIQNYLYFLWSNQLGVMDSDVLSFIFFHLIKILSISPQHVASNILYSLVSPILENLALFEGCDKSFISCLINNSILTMITPGIYIHSI